MCCLRRMTPAAVILAVACLAAEPGAQRPRYDLVIANGRIVDGTGAPWFRGDVAIAGDRIAAVGALGDRGGAQTPAASTSPQTSIRTRARRTVSIRAFRSGRARAASTGSSSG